MLVLVLAEGCGERESISNTADASAAQPYADASATASTGDAGGDATPNDVAEADAPTLSSAPDAAADEPSADGSAACPTGKIAFTQMQGCLNDGSVEFCVIKEDAALAARVRAIAPSVRENARSRGRAGCDLTTEILVLYPTPFPASAGEPAVCAGPRGAMTDAAWSQICQLAAQPEIRTIVPTWFE